jgi:hypothetical protein
MIDTKRSRVEQRPFFKVDPTAVWEAGQIATLKNIGGETVVTLLTDPANEVPLGVFWRPKAVTLTEAVKEKVKLIGTENISLSHANIEDASEIVTDLSEATRYTRGTDYVINYVNGLIARIATGGIADGQEVLVTYRYKKTAQEIAMQPQRFERVPDATLGSGMVTVIMGHAIIYTDQYDTSQQYSLNAALYVNDQGRFTSANTGSRVVGKVIAVPTVGYPLLGVELRPTII